MPSATPRTPPSRPGHTVTLRRGASSDAFLFTAIVLEVIGTSALKASEQFTKLLPVLVMVVWPDSVVPQEVLTPTRVASESEVAVPAAARHTGPPRLVAG